jgi:hypothetical protein
MKNPGHIYKLFILVLILSYYSMTAYSADRYSASTGSVGATSLSTSHLELLGTLAWPVADHMTMDNNVRVTDQSYLFLKGEKRISLLRLTASFSDNQSFPDYSVVYFDPKAKNEFDGQLDALKLMNTDFDVPNLYEVTPSGKNISIKALLYAQDSVYRIPLGLTIYRAGEIIIKIHDIEGTFSDMKISLSDRVTGINQDLLNKNEYKVFLRPGEYTGRFFLNLSN